MVFERDTDATAGHSIGRHSISRQANLDDVFDDPAHGQIGRDRLGVHFAWEGVLLLGVVVLGYLLYANHRAAVSGDGLKLLMVYIAGLGLLTFAAAVSLRVAAPNLAIGPIAVATSFWYAQNGDSGVIKTFWPVAVALGVGLGIAILVVGFHVPGWAGGLVAALAVIGWMATRYDVPARVEGTFDPTARAYYLLGGFIALSLVAGLLGLIKGIRRGVGRFRPVGDPAHRRGGLAATVTVIGLLASSALAAVAGILFASLDRVTDSPVQPSTGLELTALAIGAAMVGGTSAFGRRGGLFGTILGTTLVALLLTYDTRAGWKVDTMLIAAGVVATGLIVTRLVETFGRPLSIDESPDDWSDVGVGGTTTWSNAPSAGDPWAGLSQPAAPPPPPPPPTTTTTTQWGDTDRWRS